MATKINEPRIGLQVYRLTDPTNPGTVLGIESDGLAVRVRWLTPRRFHAVPFIETVEKLTTLGNFDDFVHEARAELHAAAGRQASLTTATVELVAEAHGIEL